MSYNYDFSRNIGGYDNLPPMTASKKDKQKDPWKKSVLDGFENIAIQQFNENLKFVDYYRMVEGKLPFRELAEIVPHLESLQELLDGVGVPTFIRHYDIMGQVVNSIVGSYTDRNFKYHITDTGEYGKNEFLRMQDDKVSKSLQQILDFHVKKGLAERGLTTEGREFASQEEQMQFMQQLQAEQQKLTPKDLESSVSMPYKTSAVKWGEATLDKDREAMNLGRLTRRELRDKLLSGRCFREYLVGYDKYTANTWNPKNVFFSKELDNDYVQRGEYVGKYEPLNPSEVIDQYGHEIPTDIQKRLLGGNTEYKKFVGSIEGASGSINQAINSNFVKRVTIPYAGYHENEFYTQMEDYLGTPLGETTRFNKDGSATTYDSFLPRSRGNNFSRYSDYSRLIRDDFEHRTDKCMVTKVYFKARDKWGFLTWENEYGRIETAEVTEDILPEFLKENNITQTLKSTLVEAISEFEPNTLKWMFRPVVYEGVKVQSPYLEHPIYVYCRPMENQIKGDSEFDALLPVAGFVGQGIAEKIEPYQSMYNYCMNQIVSLMEKEIGMFFLMDVNMIPSEFDGHGNAEDAIMNLRSVAKDVGIMPVAMAADNGKPSSPFNQFSSYNVTYGAEMASRIQMAEIAQRKAYETIGINPQTLSQPTKYETAEGVKLNQDMSFAQISELYEDFELYLQGALELHLSVAQYAQSFNKDNSLFYTKSDASLTFLKETDPTLSLRNLGILPSNDNNKRKEVETFKSLLINNNTLGSDTIELAKLIQSDAMSDMIKIAEDAHNRKTADEQTKFQQQQSLVQQDAENKKQLSEAEYAREEESKDKDRTNNIERERIKAQGRAADKDADASSVAVINAAADNALKSKTLDHKIKTDVSKLNLEEQKQEDARKQAREELKLKAQELKERAANRATKETVAIVNKN